MCIDNCDNDRFLSRHMKDRKVTESSNVDPTQLQLEGDAFQLQRWASKRRLLDLLKSSLHFIQKVVAQTWLLTFKPDGGIHHILIGWTRRAQAH